VNRAIRKHLGAAGLDIVVVAKNCEDLKKKVLDGAPSPMTYNSPKPPEVLEEDKVVERWKIDLKPDAVRILPVEKVFE
jgi:zinc protease